jgi:hypothetical protein
MRLSSEEIERQRTPAGGFTKKTLEKWGILWPPQEGWVDFLTTGKGSCACGEVFLGRKEFINDTMHGFLHNKKKCRAMKHAFDLQE